MKKLLFICICFVSVNVWATNNIVPSTAHSTSIGTALLPYTSVYADALIGNINGISGNVYFNVSIDTPVANGAFMESMPSTYTVKSIIARCRVAPVTTDITIKVSSTTLMPASLGTLTISATKKQSNALSLNVVLPMFSDLIYTIGTTGTSPDLGFNISIVNTLFKE